MKIYCDGGARGNPGPAAAAFAVIKGGKIIHKESSFLGKATNNFAEYQSVILALKWLANETKVVDSKKIWLILDSELVTRQLSGDFKVKSRTLSPLFQKAKNLEKKISSEISYRWSPRTKNRLADFLVNKELDKKT